ncbi:hypothetical protein C8F01DRAFT_369805 [Mycena amicta]|nr:hypothetical protein C8F01DRAFT_369805 [Mycena amicta]
MDVGEGDRVGCGPKRRQCDGCGRVATQLIVRRDHRTCIVDALTSSTTRKRSAATRGVAFFLFFGGGGRGIYYTRVVFFFLEHWRSRTLCRLTVKIICVIAQNRSVRRTYPIRPNRATFKIICADFFSQARCTLKFVTYAQPLLRRHLYERE